MPPMVERGRRRGGRARGTTKARTAGRDVEMVRLLAQGETLEVVGHAFGVSSAHVQQALNRQVRYEARFEAESMYAESAGSSTSRTRVKEGAPEAGARQPEREAREKRDIEIFLASSRGTSNEELAREYSLTVQRIGQIINKRIHQVRLEGSTVCLQVRSQRLTVLRSLMPGWYRKALTESRDVSVREGKALRTYLRILDQEAKYAGIYEHVRVTQQDRPKDKPSRKKVEDKLQSALQHQLRFLLGVLRNHPAAFDDVVEGLLATGRTSRAETENEARAQIGNDWMDLRTLRLSALRSVMVGWAGKALAESLDTSVREGNATLSLLRILDQEAKCLGLYKSVRVTRKQRSKDKPIQVDVQDPIVRALTYQLQFVLGILQRHPAARADVDEALRLFLSSSL